VEYFVSAGFDDVKVQYMYDPFIIGGDSPQHVKRLLADCLLDMYGLLKLVTEHGYNKAVKVAYSLSCKHFRYDYETMGLDQSFGAPHIQMFQKASRWYVEAPRVALVGTGVKPQS
jgi:hypothetical protein